MYLPHVVFPSHVVFPLLSDQLVSPLLRVECLEFSLVCLVLHLVVTPLRM